MKTQLDHKWQRIIARWKKSAGGSELSASAMSACAAFALWLWPERASGPGPMQIRKPGWPMAKFLNILPRDGSPRTRNEWKRAADERGISPRNFDRLWATAKTAGLLDGAGTLERGRMGWIVPPTIDLEEADARMAADAEARRRRGNRASNVSFGAPRKWSVENLLEPLRANGSMRAGEWRAEVMTATGMSASRFWQLRDEGLVEGRVLCEDERYHAAGAETVDL